MTPVNMLQKQSIGKLIPARVYTRAEMSFPWLWSIICWKKYKAAQANETGPLSQFEDDT